MEIKIREIMPDEFETLSGVAREIWLEHYTPLVGSAQVHYMIDTKQSPGNFKEEIERGGIYWLAIHNDKIVGYCAVLPEDGYLYLSKLYVQRDYRGQGVARKFMDKIFALTREWKLPAIRLNVNKNNIMSIATYEHMGFNIIDSVVNDIGSGYVMDDFIMELVISDDEDEPGA